MKMKAALAFLFVLMLFGWGLAQEIRPVPVSPGSGRGVARVSERCPTFSWSAIVWAAGYRVAVFEALTAEIVSYERMALTAAPVLRQDIPGKALSWTPSEGEGLKDGGSYVWYVQARDASGNGLWSAGKAFLVELEKTPIAGVEERVTRRLRERGVSADVISDVAREISPGAKAGMIAREFTLKSSGQTAAKVQAGGGGLGASRTLGNEGDARGNTYYGSNAGVSIDGNGFYNSFFGYDAGRYTTDGDDNTFMGYQAGYANTTGSDNTFIGRQAGYSNTEGTFNIFLGSYAGHLNTKGHQNTFLGHNAGYSNTTGNYNTFLGMAAGRVNSTGYSNTFLGFTAGYWNTTGNYNTFLGYKAGNSNTTGYSNAFLGSYAGLNNTSGSQNMFLGYSAGFFNTTGLYNAFLGFKAGYSNTTGYANTFLGNSAGYSNTTGYENAFLGTNAGYFNTTGFYNTFLGPGAGYKNTTGSANAFLGTNAGNQNTTGCGNTFLGTNAGYNNTAGNENTSVGTAAGQRNQIGIQNTSVGHTAGLYNAASFGTFVGYRAGFNNTSGANNTFLGWNAGGANTTGGYNTFLGRSAGYKNVTGKQNVFLGYAAGYYETGSSKLYISSSTAAFPLIYGDFSAALVAINGKLGVGVQAPAYPLHMASGALCTTGGVWTDASSRSLKENIRALSAEDAQEALAQLAPVRFNYKADTSEECLGFIAEDVPELVAIGDRKGLSSMDIVAVLAKVLQEQQKTITKLETKIAKLEENAQKEK